MMYIVLWSLLIIVGFYVLFQIEKSDEKENKKVDDNNKRNQKINEWFKSMDELRAE